MSLQQNQVSNDPIIETSTSCSSFTATHLRLLLFLLVIMCMICAGSSMPCAVLMLPCFQALEASATQKLVASMVFYRISAEVSSRLILPAQ